MEGGFDSVRWFSTRCLTAGAPSAPHVLTHLQWQPSDWQKVGWWCPHTQDFLQITSIEKIHHLKVGIKKIINNLPLPTIDCDLYFWYTDQLDKFITVFCFLQQSWLLVHHFFKPDFPHVSRTSSPAPNWPTGFQIHHGQKLVKSTLKGVHRNVGSYAGYILSQNKVINRDSSC